LPGDANGDSSPVTYAAATVLCTVAFVLLYARGVSIPKLVAKLDPVVLLLLCMILLSVFWSVDPTLTLRRIAAVLLYSVFGLYLFERFPLREQPWLVARALGIAAVASIVLALLAPRYGRMPGDPSQWRGIFTQKNVLGRAMAVSILAAVLAALLAPAGRRRGISLLIALVSLVVLFRSASVFAIVSLLVIAVPVLTFVLVRTRFPARQGLTVVVLAVAVTLLALTFQHRYQLLAAAGRDSGLTGRVPLWTSCWHALTQRPWFGYGYGAFWHGWSAPSTQVFLENPWRPPHAHNGPLDLALGIGVVGSAIWVLAVAQALLRSMRALTATRAPEAVWPFGLLLIVVAFNVTEVTTTANAFFWAFFVAITTHLALASRAVEPVLVARGRRAESTASRLIHA
jgi:O-antigen ligase